MATWPTTLPNPQFSGYGIEAQDATRRTDMEGGAARVRRVSTSVPDKATLKWLFDEAQMAEFRAFWEDEWAHGSAWVYLTIKDGRAAGLVSRECRPSPASFKAAPLSAAHWHVEMTVEVRHA